MTRLTLCSLALLAGLFFGGCGGSSGGGGAAPVSSFSITTPSLPAGSRGAIYSVTLETVNGTAPISWRDVNAAAPPGVSLSPTTGVLEGRPSATGDFDILFEATGSDGGVATKTLRVTIR